MDELLNYKIVIIGSGNVATHLSQALDHAGHTIVQIFSRKLENARELADKFNCGATSEISNITNSADLYIISISDKAIADISESLSFEPERIVHTAGSIDISALNKHKNHGVFYPLQSFSKDRKTDFNSIPICIEASNTTLEKELNELANQISEKAYSLNSEQRKECHMAAIFANNFSNHFFNIAAGMLEKKDIPFDILKPIIKETAAKIEELHPAQAQTGPAVRNDQNVINKHIEHLKGSGLEKIYRFVSESIIKSKQ